MAKVTNNLNLIAAGLRSGLKNAMDAVLDRLSTYVESAVKQDYMKRVQTMHYPVRHPSTKQEIKSMPPADIQKHLVRDVSSERSIVYLPIGSEANRSGRIQEAYGGRPWQKIRIDMQNLTYVNQVISKMNLRGIKALPGKRGDTKGI